MPPCPRCGRNDKVHSYSDYADRCRARRRLSALGDGDRARLLLDRLLLTRLRARDCANGYIGWRSGFCFFRPVGSNRDFICYYKH